MDENNQTPETPIEPKTDDVKVEETPAETPAENAAEEMKEEPKVEPTPAEPVAEPVPVAEPITEPTPVEQPAPIIEAPKAPAPETPKKSKKGLIIGVAAGVVVAGTAGGFGIAYAMDSKPENIAMSAVSDFLSSKSMAIDGVVEFNVAQTKDCDGIYSTTKCVDSSSPIESVKLEFKGDKNASNETSTNATLKVVYNGEDYEISLGEVTLKDYTLYVKIDGLKDAVKKAMKGSITVDYEDYISLYEDLIDTVVGEVDGVWWKIYVPDVVDSIEELSSSNKKTIKGGYQCAVEAADRALAKQDKYVDMYKKNAFVSLEEYSSSGKSSAKGTPYKIKIDASKFTSFMNTASKEAIDTEFDDCMKKVSSSYSGSSEYTELKESDVKSALENFPEIIVTIDNGFFSHSITGIYYAKSDDSYNGKIDLKFNKDAKAVSAPSDAKNVTELYKNVKKAYEEWQETAACKVMKLQYPTYYKTYCNPTTNKPKPEYESQFKRTDTNIFEV